MIGWILGYSTRQHLNFGVPGEGCALLKGLALGVISTRMRAAIQGSPVRV